MYCLIFGLVKNITSYVSPIADQKRMKPNGNKRYKVGEKVYMACDSISPVKWFFRGQLLGKGSKMDMPADSNMGMMPADFNVNMPADPNVDMPADPNHGHASRSQHGHASRSQLVTKFGRCHEIKPRTLCQCLDH